jgi:hypothetical protein
MPPICGIVPQRFALPVRPCIESNNSRSFNDGHKKIPNTNGVRDFFMPPIRIELMTQGFSEQVSVLKCAALR